MNFSIPLPLAISIVFALVAAFFALTAVSQRMKQRGYLNRGMNLKLFLVTVPQKPAEKEKPPSLADYLKTIEQFYSSLSGFKESNKFKRMFLGHPALVFEVSVHYIGEEICFYLACPRNQAQMVEKQILAFWPDAEVRPTNDYNIFNPAGVSVGATASLAKTPVFPLKTSQDFGTDPLSAIASTFTKLTREGEGASVQIMIRKSKRSLKKLAEKIVNFTQTQMIKTEDAARIIESKTGVMGVINDMGKLVFPETKKSPEQQATMPRLAPEQSSIQKTQITAISQKASQPLFDVNLRVLASAQTGDRAKEILGQLQSAFDQFSLPILNQIKFRTLSGNWLKKLFYRFSFRIFNEAESILLSSGELAGIFHFPQTNLLTPHIKSLKAKQAPPPTNLPQQGLIIGKNVFRGEERIVCALKDDRRRHFYLIGQTGTGKSVLLQEMIRQDILNGEGVAFIDPHGETAEKILGFVPASRAEDVIYLNPSDVDRPVGLNMLEFDPRFPESKTLVVNEMLEIFEKLYNLKTMGFGGPMFEQYMRNALLLIMEDPNSGNTLIEIPRVLADTSFRKYKLSRCKNMIVKNFWEMEAEKAGGEASLANMVPYITSKTNVFIANDLLRPIISQQQSSFNFRQIMDEKKILIVNLSKGRLGDINSYLLGMIVVGKMLIAAFSRSDILEPERQDFFLYIDEFHNVTTKSIASALAEARKYRLNLILSHQFLAQIDEDTRKAIFGNVGSFLAFRVGPEDGKFLTTEFAPIFDENDLVNFDNYNAALKLLINGQTANPFNIVTFPPSQENQEVKRLIKELSRTKYGRNRALVEDELYQRLQTISPKSA